MLSIARLVFILAGLASLAFAQGEGDLPKCAQQCVGNSLSSTGCQTTDVKCICSSANYISNLSCCVVNACSASDIQSTINFANQICSLQGVSLPKSASCASSSNMMSTAAPGGTSSGMAATATSGAPGSMGSGGENMMSGGSSATNTMAGASASATGAAGRDFVGLGAAAVAGIAGMGALML